MINKVKVIVLNANTHVWAVTYRNGVDIDQGYLGREKVDIAAGNCPVKGSLDQLRQVGRDLDGRHTVRQCRHIVTECARTFGP